uniref:Ig-like domain-containing protein n=1 Tax=Calidris pygmaea TaxID=425635 RepID=A0A8C3JT76_9CHAR
MQIMAASLLNLKALSGLTGHAQKDSVLQFPPETTIQAGHNATLHCNFSTSSSGPYIFWYQQHQTQSPCMLLRVDKWKPRVDSGRFFSSMSDSAAYFCALSPHWCPQLAAVHRKVGVL